MLVTRFRIQTFGHTRLEIKHWALLRLAHKSHLTEISSHYIQNFPICINDNY